MTRSYDPHVKPHPASCRLPVTSVGILPPVASLLARPAEVIVPTRLGRSFRWLLAATLVNNTGDGIVLAAGPLLVASQTQ